MEIVLATHNPDKLREISDILSPVGFDLRALDEFDGAPEAVEDGRTLEENALKKARAIRVFTGLSALADDTGLEVDALGGAPGVFSSRYAGESASYEDNCRKLLDELSGISDEMRTARFRCVIAVALVKEYAESARHLAEALSKSPHSTVSSNGGRIDALVTEGIVEGRITTSPRGKSGFGYDPVFEVLRLGLTFAEMGSAEKNRSSHRYRALIEMRELLIRLRQDMGG
ncbi:MAG: non-canonical purine NTP pyrophosphatase [Candidatus Latescibacteria bacterium]|nr:non-canonical purine NTP pyrophosphatase [Candidatus Latescibacterota bacterium]NIM64498.1 non-canonical purine NTP pyrophosphatase [Candidatus Latescibacterota bacterium]NIO00651.1 non-canonical purine NTP pyrophosphatase [Candidatus Latescibacterota bacterium]NIO27054.1 non-canonical purine NTP pyrophosphatase [Candidatus Latescibacterota bacterium]NIO54578.1 non-canonical purine NTP pyrophosphatase [Candidatus Latescibacterota bacterium]